MAVRLLSILCGTYRSMSDGHYAYAGPLAWVGLSGVTRLLAHLSDRENVVDVGTVVTSGAE